MISYLTISMIAVKTVIPSSMYTVVSIKYVPVSTVPKDDIRHVNDNHTKTKAGDNVSKPNCSHGDEAKVESIKEGDIFINTEEVGTNAKKYNENQKTSKSNANVAGKSTFLLLIPAYKI